jgi:hypothetical protein
VQPEEILFRVEGKMSTFGGPHDLGMVANEDLALFTKADLQNPKYAYSFLPAPPPGTFGHDFAPGYCRPGGTSCPDKLFGLVHSQSSIVVWVEANV